MRRHSAPSSCPQRTPHWLPWRQCAIRPKQRQERSRGIKTSVCRESHARRHIADAQIAHPPSRTHTAASAALAASPARQGEGRARTVWAKCKHEFANRAPHPHIADRQTSRPATHKNIPHTSLSRAARLHHCASTQWCATSATQRKRSLPQPRAPAACTFLAKTHRGTLLTLTGYAQTSLLAGGSVAGQRGGANGDGWVGQWFNKNEHSQL